MSRFATLICFGACSFQAREAVVDAADAPPPDSPPPPLTAPLAEYRFDASTTGLIGDSGAAPAVDLTIKVGGGLGGIDNAHPSLYSLQNGTFDTLDGYRILLTQAMGVEKIRDGCTQSGELTLELWVTVAAAHEQVTGPRVVMSMSTSRSQRNFSLAYGGTANRAGNLWHFRVRRSIQTGGFPDIIAAAPPPVDVAHHVVARYDANTDAVSLWVNAAEQSTNFVKSASPTSFSVWSPMPLNLLDELTYSAPPDYSFPSPLHYAAVYCKWLSDEELKRRYLLAAP